MLCDEETKMAGQVISAFWIPVFSIRLILFDCKIPDKPH